MVVWQEPSGSNTCGGGGVLSQKCVSGAAPRWGPAHGCLPAGPVAGLDIGCGANLIYPLLAAALCGWRMVGADVAPAALEWAARNLGANPQLRPLIELRQVAMQPQQARLFGEHDGGLEVQATTTAADGSLAGAEDEAVPAALVAAAPAPVVRLGAAAAGPGLVSGALRRGERLAFCMCNPPFFESMDEAGCNPATAYGGTAAEMVYPGGQGRLSAAPVRQPPGAS